MAKVWSTNQALATNFGDAVYYLVTHLTTYGGWTIYGAGQGSGSPGYNNGTPATAATFFSQGIMNGTTYSGAACWVRIQHSTGRELVFYRGASNYLSWTISYSKSSGFTGGSPSSTVPPTASDVSNLLGTAPTTVAAWVTESTSMRVHLCADSASPYGFYMWACAAGLGRTLRGGSIFWCPLSGASVANADPFVWYVPKSVTAGRNWIYNEANSATAEYINNGGAGMFAHNGTSLGTAHVLSLINYAATSSSDTLGCASSAGTDAYDPWAPGNDVSLPAIIMKGNSNSNGVNHIFGYTNWILFSVFQSSTRACGYQNTVATAGDYIYVSADNSGSLCEFLIPWNGGSWTG